MDMICNWGGQQSFVVVVVVTLFYIDLFFVFLVSYIHMYKRTNQNRWQIFQDQIFQNPIGTTMTLITAIKYQLFQLLQ